jgi:hypothetical protein
MVEHDGLSDNQIPISRRCPGLNVVSRLTGELRPGLTDLRNDLVDGAPSDDSSSAGLLEIVRDLIEHAYRDRTSNLKPRPR